MGLAIRTYSNVAGGSALFKALGHPLAAPHGRALARRLAEHGPVAVYDPHGHLADFAALYSTEGWRLAGVYVQRIEDLGRRVLDQPVQPVTALASAAAARVLIADFDHEAHLHQIGHLVPGGAMVESFDGLRLPEALLSRPGRYLDPLNFATNLAFLRDGDGQRTRLVTANYWHGYGARGSRLWLRLFDADGGALATWEEALSDGLSGVVIDSAEVRRRFRLAPFAGSLFLHVIGAAGHDVVKYALDTEDGETLSCTHDANAFPADLYAGLPAPAAGERVLLWVQNSHPAPIPAGAVGLRRMGRDETAWYDHEVPPFATRALDVGALLPGVTWPAQIEVVAGRHFVRPRYEVVANGRRRIAHANVERTDLAPDPRLAEIANLVGKGFLLPAPVMPLEGFTTTALVTPMATDQTHLPVALAVYDASGREVLRHRPGVLPRDHATAFEIDALLAEAGASLDGGTGHLELTYDLAAGAEADGWLHGLFRYRTRRGGHAAETSFGAHMFNLPITYRNEPQSYAARPPGLSTRLFLRLGRAPHDTFCHLIYPVSAEWHRRSETRLTLFAGDGREVAVREVGIPVGGSHHWRLGETFAAAEIAAAAEGGYVIVRDLTCRLFGYHGLIGAGGAFSLDHMFGF